jgi:hypothetical protein
MKYKLHKDWCKSRIKGNDCTCRSVDINKILEDKEKSLEYILQLEDALFQSAEAIAGCKLDTPPDYDELDHILSICDNLVPEEPA